MKRVLMKIENAPSASTIEQPSAASLSNPKAHAIEQVDDYFGTKVSDPYRWMEDVDAPAVKEWIDAENRLTRSVLDGVAERGAIHRRLMQLIDFERFTAPVRKGSRYFYSHNSGLQNQNVIYWT